MDSCEGSLASGSYLKLAVPVRDRMDKNKYLALL